MAAPPKAAPAPLILDAGTIFDELGGAPVKDTAKERLRQRVIRALAHEHAIPLAHMQRAYKLPVAGKRRAIDLAIFTGAEHDELERIVLCAKAPKRSSKRALELRSHAQAEQDFGPLYAAMSAVESCRYGLWTNGREFFFVEKTLTGEGPRFRPLGDWPSRAGSPASANGPRLRTASAEMLLTTFERCHDYIHGNEGMPKDAAFWQFLYLIFAKLHDERRPPQQPARFWVGVVEAELEGKRQPVAEQFEPAGQQAIRARIEPLFAEVRDHYAGTIFRGDERLTLSDRALAFIVAELAKYDLGRTGLDAKGVAYQELVGTNLRGDRGQYFTPRGPIELMVQMFDPGPDARVIDPSCGTGGFLVATLEHLQRAHGLEPEALGAYARSKLFGADFDPFLIRAAQMNVVMSSGVEGQLFNMNSLEFPRGALPGVATAGEAAALGTMDLVLSNPPFGADIPITDRNILSAYELAHEWRADASGEFVRGKLKTKVAPEVLFIERAYQWLREGGRAGLVLPNGILGNPSDEYIRAWLLRNCWILASVELPVEVFVVEAKVNILTSLLLIKRKRAAQIAAWDRGERPDYPVFMAEAQRVGFDRRGHVVYARSPDGEVRTRWVESEVSVVEDGVRTRRTLRRREKIVDDDLPRIARAYREFRAEHPEPE